MDDGAYEPRYLAGIVLFNRGDFFEAHEVWESLWMEMPAPEKKFVQGLIQAAVGLCHFCNGNRRGAAKLYRSAREYMFRFPPTHWGLDLERFWADMEVCFREVLTAPEDATVAIDEERIPTISISPEPETWPDPEPFREDA